MLKRMYQLVHTLVFLKEMERTQNGTVAVLLP